MQLQGMPGRPDAKEEGLRKGRLPLDEGLAKSALAAADIVLRLRGEPGTPVFLAAMEEYRRRLAELSRSCPGVPMWQVERAILPERLRNPRLSLHGLPEAAIPFSLADCWHNERLDAAIGALVPKDGKKSFYAGLIAQMLDRYVESAFPPQEISEFFRGPVLALGMRRNEGGYEEAVVAEAWRLAERCLSGFIDGNAKPFKLSIHKNIDIKTGVHLSESSPDSKPGPVPRRAKMHLSIADRMGIAFDSMSIAKSIAGSMGLPIFDGLARPGRMKAKKVEAPEIQQAPAAVPGAKGAAAEGAEAPPTLPSPPQRAEGMAQAAAESAAQTEAAKAAPEGPSEAEAPPEKEAPSEEEALPEGGALPEEEAKTDEIAFKPRESEAEPETVPQKVAIPEAEPVHARIIEAIAAIEPQIPQELVQAPAVVKEAPVTIVEAPAEASAAEEAIEAEAKAAEELAETAEPVTSGPVPPLAETPLFEQEAVVEYDIELDAEIPLEGETGAPPQLFCDGIGTESIIPQEGEERTPLREFGQELPLPIVKALQEAAARAKGQAVAPEPVAQILVPSTRQELYSILTVVVRSGREARHAHPDLRGIEFESSQCEAAIRLVSLAENRIMGATDSPLQLSEEWQRAVEKVEKNPEFAPAFEARDRAKEMKAALMAWLHEERAAKFAKELGQDEAYARAIEDIRVAMALVAEYRELRQSGQMPALRSMRRMDQLSRMQEHFSSSDIEIAFELLDEQRRPKPEAAPMGGTTPAEAEAEAAAPAQPDAAAPPEAKVEIAAVELVAAKPAKREESLAGPAEGEKITELAFPFGNPLQGEEFEKAIESLCPKAGKRGSSKYKRSRLIRNAARTLSYYLSNNADPDLVAPCYKDAYPRLSKESSPQEIIQVAAVVVSRYGGLAPDESEDAKGARGKSEQKDVPLARIAVPVAPDSPGAKIELEFPFGNYKRGPDFENALDELVPKADRKTGALNMRNALIRNVARTLCFYIESNAPSDFVAPCYKDEYPLLSKSSTHKEIILAAAKVVKRYGVLPSRDKDAAGADSPAVADAANAAAHERTPTGNAPAVAPQQDSVKAAASKKRFSFGFPNALLNADDALTGLLPENIDDRTADIRKVARALAWYVRNGFREEDIDARCIEAVRLLRKDYNHPAIVAFAKAIVDGEPMPEIMPESQAGVAVEPKAAVMEEDDWDDKAQISISPLRLALERLDAHQQELISGATGMECGEDAVARFLALKPAHAELLMQRYIASRWTEGDWRIGVENLRGAKEKIFDDLAIPRPTESEKLELIRNPMLLSGEQRAIIATLFDIEPEKVGANHIDGFRLWVSSDPESAEGRNALQGYWDAHYVDHMTIINLARKIQVPGARFTKDEMMLLSGIYGKETGQISREDLRDVGRAVAFAKALEEKYFLWLYTQKAERLSFWKRGVIDVQTPGAIIHSLRFGEGAAFSAEESALVRSIYNNVRDAANLDAESKNKLRLAFMGHAFDTGQVETDDNGKEKKILHYYPEMLSLAQYGYAMTSSSLLSSARREAEYNTLLDFLGVQAGAAQGRVLCRHGQSRHKDNAKTGAPEPNEDSYSSARIQLADGSVLTLDLVADGMGGMDSGANGGETNAQAASRIAREMFEMASIAGWLRTPEDVRRLELSVDIAIVMEQIRKKEHSAALEAVSESWRSQGADPLNVPPQWQPEFDKQVLRLTEERMKNTDAIQRNNMGTTMTVFLQHGRKGWFIHCGDSDGKIIRDGNVIFSTDEHTVKYSKSREYRPAAVEEISEYWRSQGFDPDKLEEGQAAEFERQVGIRINEKLEAYRADMRSKTGRDPFAKNVIASALGAMPLYLQINNMDGGGGPLQIEPDDLVLLSSDGFSVPVCDHEISIMLYGQCAGNVDSALANLVELANGRRSTGPHDTLCECGTRKGKMDDISLLLRLAGEGFDYSVVGGGQYDPLSYLERRVRDDAPGFGESEAYRRLLQGSATMPRQMLDNVFDSFIVAADSAPEGAASGACELALSFISSSVSMRAERDELIENLRPMMEEWRGLILKRLRESETAEAPERVLFDLLGSEVEPEALGILQLARCRAVASWAREAAGVEEPVPESVSPPPMFHDQKTREGDPLLRWETKYLDEVVLDVQGSTIMKDMAGRLGVLARDLEIMVFYVYTDFDPRKSVEPHLFADGESLIAEVGNYLCTRDAERIITASYLIYCLKETEVEPDRALEMVNALWKTVKGMDPVAPYYLTFNNTAFSLIGPDLSGP